MIDDIDDDGFWGDDDDGAWDNQEQTSNLDGSAQSDESYGNIGGSLSEEGDSLADEFFASHSLSSANLDGKKMAQLRNKMARGSSSITTVDEVAPTLWDALDGKKRIKGASKDELEGMSTEFDTQLRRIGHLDYKQQNAISTLLSGGNVQGIHPVDAAAAVSAFSKVIGTTDTASFARAMNVPEAPSAVSRIHPTTGEVLSTIPYAMGEDKDLREVISVLQNSSGTYMDRGPGGALIGYNLTGENPTDWQREKQAKADEDFIWANETVKKIAGIYIHPNSIGTPAEDIKMLALQESITNRFINSSLYEGSNNILALPNETGVLGIIPTQGIYGKPKGDGTRHDRFSAGAEFDKYYKQLPSDGSKTNFLRNDKGYKVFRDDVSKERQTQILQDTPNLANSLFPKPKPKRGTKFTDAERAKHTSNQKLAMLQLTNDANKARKILRQETLTTHDEILGNTQRFEGWNTPKTEQDNLANLRNENSTDGGDWNAFYAGSAESDANRDNEFNDIINEQAAKADGSHIRDDSEDEWQGAHFVPFGLDGEGKQIVDEYGRKGAWEGDRDKEGVAIGIAPKETISSYVEPVRFDPSFPYKQGSKGWLKQREGHITASIAGKLLTESGRDSITYTMGRKRLGIEDIEDDFDGNAYTREGNEGEPKALAAFLASKHGKGLTHQEAFFETNPDIPGFGVSPDGRLYDKDGKSAGLLELKFLGDSTMPEAVKTYTPQVQLQMAVSGETQTHFFALNKQTNKYYHKLILADPKMQEEIIKQGTATLARANNLDAEGAQILRNEKKFKKREPEATKEELAGQQKSIEIEDEVDEPMTAFQTAIMTGASSGGGGAASITKLAKKLEQQDQAEKMKQATNNAKDLPTGDIITEGIRLSKKSKPTPVPFVDDGYQSVRNVYGAAENTVFAEKMIAAEQAERLKSGMANSDNAAIDKADKTEVAVMKKRRLAESKLDVIHGEALREDSSRYNQAIGSFKNNQARSSVGNVGADNDTLTSMADFYKAEQAKAKTADTEMSSIEGEAIAENKEFDKAAKQADKDTAKAAKEASTNLREFGNAVKKAGSLLGTLYDLLKQGVGSATTTSKVATETDMDINDVRDLEYGISKNTDLSQPESLGLISKVGELRASISTESGQADFINKVMPTLAQQGVQLNFQDLSKLSTTELLDTLVSKAPVDPSEQRQYYSTLGISDAIHLRGRQTSELTIDARDIDQDAIRKQISTVAGIEQTKQDALEAGAEKSPELLTQGLGYGAVVAGVASAVVGSNVATKGAKLMQASKYSSVVKAGKGLSHLAKATPFAVAASVAPMAIRHFANIKDDGGMGDTAMDIVDFASYGAAAGAFVGPMGAAIGAAGGALIGAGWEAYEHFSADNVVPNTNIGNMPMQGNKKATAASNVVNVEVTNEISPDLIRTVTNVNGDLSVDEESGIGTGA